ncbi:signal peptide peptidase SppA [Candidatus Phycosocius spiralis]|uniref:Protease n=1 Tax=Candidatus Phycosocius spiralis TaxID=2815099 RepID=A0ABQ4PVD4_9PROT|nr:signal peptide peptidase SppA [Candidatus Phycosocius spiralis]GIU66890.1 protease [Candidatus Phycosocius spiralis]
MKQFLITIAGVFMGLVLFFVLIPIILIASVTATNTPTTPTHTVLSLDLRNTIADVPSTSPFSGFNKSISVVDIVRKLQAAETDKSVKGLFIRASEGGLAPAHAEEIRQALVDFKSTGKFVIVHAQGFEYPTLSNYVAISGGSELWMQGSTDFAATGLVAETIFLGGLMEKFGIIPQFEQFKEYKNAVNIYTEKTYNAPHREATTSLLDSIYSAFLASTAFDRKMPVEAIKAALDQAPLSAEAALKAKLIDKIGQPEEALDAALTRAGGADKASVVELADYAASAGTGPVIALIGGEGAIVTGEGNTDPFSQETSIASDDFAGAIRDATDDDDVKAIILRVSSPGGSASASDQIWAAVERAKKAGKPVVVSMGAYAASGGYYVSTGADAILAMPSTITGSIGVFNGKFVINDALNRYTGANIAAIEVGGPFANAYSAATPYTNSQKLAMNGAVTRIYEDFTSKVAAGRRLPIARVLEMAKGRVWSGESAKELGLVDQIGGIRAAILKAKALAKIDAKDSISLRTYPAVEDPITALSKAFGASAHSAKTLARAATVLGALAGDERLSQLISQSHQSKGPVMNEPVRVR